MPTVNTMHSGVDSTLVHAVAKTVAKTMEKAIPQTTTKAMASHDCCPSTTVEAQPIAVGDAYCPHCFDNCQCDNAYCQNMHHSTAALPQSNTVVSLNHSQSISAKSVIMISAVLAQEQRPPKPF